MSSTRLTIRARLTLVYGGLFLLAGLLLLGVTYALVSQRLPDRPSFTVSGSLSGSGSAGARQTDPGLVNGQQTSPPARSGDADPPYPAGNLEQVNRAAVETRQDALDALLTQGGIALGVVGAAAIAFGWLIAGRLLQPLHRVTETARRIAGAPDADRGLHERIAFTGPPDEIKELSDTFDVMLERLDHAFDSQRRFIANASHELRTPLTLNRTLLEVAVDADTASVELRQLRTTLLAVNARHERLIDGLLLLARSEREVADRAYLDLADVVEHVVAQVPPGPVAVHVEAAEAPVTGNSVLLERLVQNLVENGVRHNVPQDGWVRISSGAGPDGTVVLRVANTGPVVPGYEVPRLFEPFRRLVTDRLAAGTPGAGLGLSIVRAVALAHGGTAHTEPRDGGGLVVTVSLPAAA
ncbi:HAMP domain-containing histidine kinase [Plantactinospora sp. S1510]|uniref:histidine kinase n=1 Tax=Plantactinospora alkalitolerans TaxID=2789879 RepID=A0ABS0HA25_9ACTN|nr:HAMP domain-containing sensor histidine kinase [Plantactinospora alkalitolerans]MBF9134937.1 HAMP domain-containing histidine kinase [Plantactinospora alkalitolerans]